MHVFALQFNIAWEDKAANYSTVRHLLNSARPPPGSLIVLPELFATGFSLNTAITAEPPAGQTARFLSNLASQTQCHLLAGCAIVRDNQVSNDAILFSPAGNLTATYSKMRLFLPSGEQHHHVPGSTITTTPIHSLTLAPLICFDLRFPELFRSARQAGADTYAVLASWPAQRAAHWRALLIARAIENQAYVIGVNRCGLDPLHSYNGGSIIIDPTGTIIAEAADGPAFLSAPLNPDLPRTIRQAFPMQPPAILP